MATVDEAKTQLDKIIKKGRVDLYKPIQIAEVLYRSRTVGDIDPLNLDTYRTQSIHWRNTVSRQLLGKVSTSSAQFQHNLWQDNAMPPHLLAVLDAENQSTEGAVERYIYYLFIDRQATIATIIDQINQAVPATFQLADLLQLFVTQPGIRRSIDKAYEIVAYSLFEALVCGLEAEITIQVPIHQQDLLSAFADLAQLLLGLDGQTLQQTLPAHIYRVGVTNAADRGLDMWANFGVAIQVKHMTLSEELATEIVDQVESDQLVIVCRDAEAAVISTIMKQISYGRRVQGIVKESDLIRWYELCLRGKFADRLAQPLLQRLADGFSMEFPQATYTASFCEARGYTNLNPPARWRTTLDA